MKKENFDLRRSVYALASLTLFLVGRRIWSPKHRGAGISDVRCSDGSDVFDPKEAEQLLRSEIPTHLERSVLADIIQHRQ